jgi:hypothetical protein
MLTAARGGIGPGLRLLAEHLLVEAEQPAEFAHVDIGDLGLQRVVERQDERQPLPPNDPVRATGLVLRS